MLTCLHNSTVTPGELWNFLVDSGFQENCFEFQNTPSSVEKQSVCSKYLRRPTLALPDHSHYSYRRSTIERMCEVCLSEIERSPWSIGLLNVRKVSSWEKLPPRLAIETPSTFSNNKRHNCTHARLRRVALKLIERKLRNSFILDVTQERLDSLVLWKIKDKFRRKINFFKICGRKLENRKIRRRKVQESQSEKMFFKSLMLSSLLALVASQQLRKFFSLNFAL